MFTCSDFEYKAEMTRLDNIAKVADKQAIEYYRRAREHVAMLP